MKQHKVFFFHFFATCLFFLASCQSDYLDKMPEAEGYDFDKVFKDSTNYRNFCDYLVQHTFFLHLENGVKPYGSWDDVSDNSISGRNSNDVPALQVANGDFYSIRTNGNAAMANNATWEQIWKHIRVANTGIMNIEHYSGSEATKQRLLGTCYFYRAFAYMDLTRRWGGMPYFYLPIDASANMDYPRLTMRETYKRAAADCDSAAMYLRVTIPENEFQHPTKIGALALKSRILLYAASEQARNEPGSDGENLWEEAALAADEAIRLAEDAGHELVPWADYYYIFKGGKPEIYTKEVLHGRRQSIAWGSDAYRNTIRPPGQLNGQYGGVSVNQLFVDDFEMKNGLPIEDPASGYYEQNPYVNRDPRFEYNVLHNGSTVMNRTMQIWNETEGTSAMGSTDCQINATGTVEMGYTRTSYYAAKWMGNTWNTVLPLLWPYIRLAELYLNFAEASNEAWGDPAVRDGRCRYSAAEAVNKVRNRANMLDVNTKFLGQDDFRERVRNERRVELCFEEHRIFDIRRWKIATQPEYRDLWRMKLVKLAAGYNAATYPTGFRYERLLERQRIFQDRHYLYVIKLNDTRIGPNFTQNPGW